MKLYLLLPFFTEMRWLILVWCLVPSRRRDGERRELQRHGGHR